MRLLAIAAVVLLAGCTAGAPAGEVHTVGTYTEVAYYPACGNELLQYEGSTWYPIEAEPGWVTPSAQAEGASGGRGIATSVHRVVSPGPGDDVGTLTIFDNGTAYWVSDNGDLDTWLTTDEITYDWVC